MIIGHVAIALLQHQFLNTELAPTLAGGLFPDVVDKTLCHVLKVTPSGRMWAHTVLSVALSTGAIRLWAGRRAARSWALGYMGHLLADGESIPWWYPFKSYAFERSEPLGEILKRFMADRREVALELGLLLWAMFLMAATAAALQGPLLHCRGHGCEAERVSADGTG